MLDEAVRWHDDGWIGSGRSGQRHYDGWKGHGGGGDTTGAVVMWWGKRAEVVAG